MTGRHAAADDIDDAALAEQPREPGAHRADVDPVGEPVPVPAIKKPPAGRRAATPKENS
jgi:hypothetical protein